MDDFLYFDVLCGYIEHQQSLTNKSEVFNKVYVGLLLDNDKSGFNKS